MNNHQRTALEHSLKRDQMRLETERRLLASAESFARDLAAMERKHEESGLSGSITAQHLHTALLWANEDAAKLSAIAQRTELGIAATRRALSEDRDEREPVISEQSSVIS